MVCLTIAGRDFKEIAALLDNPLVEMAEVRLDSCRLSDEEIGRIFSCSDIPLIATCRIGRGMEPLMAERRLSAAIAAGAQYVDLEIDAPALMGKRLRREARDNGTVFIRSIHDNALTPSREKLEELYDTCRRFGAETVKIVTTARSAEDVETIRNLYVPERNGALIAFCMGKQGRESRVRCLEWGAPFTYACPDGDEPVADGQIQLSEMMNAVYGSFESISFDGIELPSSKSFAQRAIIAAALAEGTSSLGGFTSCSDNMAAVEAARTLGARISQKGDTLTITGIGPIRERLPALAVHAGQSGLLARLLIPVLSAIAHEPSSVTGEGTLLRRPLAGANDIMAAFGVVLSNEGENQGREIHIPSLIRGSLMPGRADVSGRGGSQLISGLLMALPLTDRGTTLFVHDPRSIPYMFITMDILRRFGVLLSSEMEGDEEFLETRDWALCTGVTFRIKGGQSYRGASFTLEKDWSAAAPFCVAAAIFGSIRLRGLDTKSLQADISIIDILADAGACVSEEEDGTVDVFRAPLNAFECDLNNAPDLFPIVSVLAAFCPGRSYIGGLSRLAGKESNRAKSIVNMLTQMGVEVASDSDILIVQGETLCSRILSGRLLKGGEYTSCHDHRMVMALRVAAIGAEAPVQIDDEQCVSKSYPAFLREMERCLSMERSTRAQ